MEVLKFQANIHEEVAMKFDGPRPVEGRFGNQDMYTWTDGRVSYLPPIVLDRITKLNIQPGEPIDICKAEVSRGQKRGIEWQVKRVNPAPETAAASPAAASNHQEMQHNNTANGSTAKLAVINGNPQGQAEEAAIAAKIGVATQLADALKTAIAAAAAAEEFAKGINYSVRFTSEDIRTMGNTLLIGKQREQNGGYR
jgi:hypothetical protein